MAPNMWREAEVVYRQQLLRTDYSSANRLGFGHHRHRPSGGSHPGTSAARPVTRHLRPSTV